QLDKGLGKDSLFCLLFLFLLLTAAPDDETGDRDTTDPLHQPVCLKQKLGKGHQGQCSCLFTLRSGQISPFVVPFLQWSVR
ncbi:Uncharacterized protein DAT39_005751, partial [Clarias magur]